MLDEAAIFSEIDRCFLQPELLERVRVFARTSRQVKGWFKGELLYLFTRLAKDGQVSRWASDVPVTEGSHERIDFRMDIADRPLYLELRAIYHRPESSTTAELGSHYRDDIYPDVVKLCRLSGGEPYCLLFIYPRPDPDTWSQMMSTLKRRLAPVSIREGSSIGDFPPELYICKLAVKGGF